MTFSHQAFVWLLLGFLVALTLVTARGVSGQRQRGVAQFHTDGKSFSPAQNGFALAGDYLSAASFLGVAGLVALYGYDGMVYSVGFLAAWLLVLLLAAELVRNCGRLTLADVLVTRLRERPVRVATGVSSIVVSVLYLVAQMVGAGTLVALLLGDAESAIRTWTLVGVGALVIVYVMCGGIRATTWVQVVKTGVLMSGALALTVLVLLRFEGDLGSLLSSAAEHSGQGDPFLGPGLLFGEGLTSRTDFVSLGVALVLGTVGLPHVLARLSTVPTARAARRSVVWAIGLVGGFFLMTILLGLGAAALLGSQAVREDNAAGNTAVPLLARYLGGGEGTPGGAVLFTAVTALALVLILAVVAGVTLVSAVALAHDLYTSRAPCRRRGGEVAVVRGVGVAIGAAALGLGLLVQDLNVALLVGLAFAVAASAHLPVLLYTLFWRRFTTRGALYAVYGGLASALLLLVFSPVVSGSAGAIFPGVDFAVFPLRNPGVVSIPLGFLAGWLGTVTDTRGADVSHYAETEVRALTGAGAT